MPNVLACYRCGTYESDIMYFDIEEGCIYCKDCYRNNALTAPLGVVTAMRYICLTDDVAKSFHLNSATKIYKFFPILQKNICSLEWIQD